MENIVQFVENRLSEERLKTEEKTKVVSEQLWEKIYEVIYKVAKETMGKLRIYLNNEIDKLVEEEVTPKIDNSKTYVNVNFMKLSTKIKQLTKKEEKTETELEQFQKYFNQIDDKIRGFSQQLNSIR
jgi:organic radical activating enzyme